ncbi:MULTISPECIES: sigma-70 family RNA polymerase sigma factor [Lonsdalea]|uniref:RNA polymerase subunit sigma-24 n=2 Tax=Lonsdalea TaxID=1082702 RepID=A0ACD1JBC3_9GAMM|nr:MULTISPECIES: sigma-70 family RNA polymerase sigma factor [Lonsdalea]OSM94862.1 RNA polymerase subunit sigma-24 [Lonsdalea populi]RAT12886.1 RNA polymerase subunit sigma-24 [Lonsdalea quercina]RAT20329.1 RNA polymerase subunit sigma-24 [Lonsdalea populi]RAT22065.1 RNA polymerase subunit sigma-24 [Lonsdalea populi]RAT26734.1 RNA polymerase subunit sigma-24 [Lonsdalea populi]
MSAVDVPTSSDFCQLYQHHHGWLQNLLRKRLGNRCDASDLAQDVFLQLLITPREFDSHHGTRAYLSVMAQGLCVDLWRRKALEQAWLASLQHHAADASLSAEQNAIVLETLFQVDGMLRHLPEKVRSAFVMSQIQGMTYAQIAAVLKVSERMVKKYMAQAMLHCIVLETESDAEPPSRPS